MHTLFERDDPIPTLYVKTLASVVSPLALVGHDLANGAAVCRSRVFHSDDLLQSPPRSALLFGL